MEKIVNGIVLEYSIQDEDLMNEISRKLAEKSQNIMNFFELNEVKNFKIKIWDNLKDFKNHLIPFLEENGEKYCDWMNAHTYDSNINILPVRLASLSTEHKNITNEEIAIDACHEFVHICQAKAHGENNTQNPWFWEALATNLGNPEVFGRVISEFEKSVHFEDLENVDDLNNAINDGSYKYAYLMGNYMLKNISHKQILNYVKDEKLLNKNVEKILNEAKVFYKDFSQNQKANIL